ncbi:hypothetical protein Tco_0438781 [Tanacetum coccineum]
MTGCRRFSVSLTELKAKPDDRIQSYVSQRFASSWSQVAFDLKNNEQQDSYEDFEQIDKLDFEEMVIKWQIKQLDAIVLAKMGTLQEIAEQRGK